MILKANGFSFRFESLAEACAWGRQHMPGYSVVRASDGTVLAKPVRGGR